MDQPLSSEFLAFCRRFHLDPGMLKEGMDTMSKAPNYRPAEDNKKCSTCRHFTDGTCTLYSFDASYDYTCDSWSG